MSSIKNKKTAKRFISKTIFLLLILLMYGFNYVDFQNNSDNKLFHKSENLRLIVGTYTRENSKGIYSFDFDTTTGKLTNEQLLVETSNPSYLVLSKDKETVFSVNEGDMGKVHSFRWNANKTKLTLISEQSSEGAAPCFIQLNESESLLAVANYTSGTLAVYPVNRDGKIEEKLHAAQHEGSGPFLPNQKSPHVHSVKFDKNSKFLYAADLGIDKIISYPITKDITLGKQQTALQLDPGDGPRHFVFHPKKDLVFIVNELSNTVVSAKVNYETGIFEKIDKKSTLPQDYTGKNSGADIRITSNGKFLYTSNRGHNSIAVFAIEENGKLKFLETIPVQGDWPRNFTLTPDENFLLVANERSNTITVFKVDKKSGLLTYTNNKTKIGAPVCLKF